MRTQYAKDTILSSVVTEASAIPARKPTRIFLKYFYVNLHSNNLSEL